MKKPVVAVYDSAVGAYASPIVVVSRGVAVRSFTDEVNRADPQNQLHNHPEDFEMRLLAYFDEDTGVFYNTESGVAEPLCRAKDVVVVKQ